MTQAEKNLLNRKLRAYDKAHVQTRVDFIIKRKLSKKGDKAWAKYCKKAIASYDKMQRANRRWYGFTIRMAMKYSSPHVDLKN